MSCVKSGRRLTLTFLVVESIRTVVSDGSRGRDSEPRSVEDLNAITSERRVSEETYEISRQVNLDGGVERSEESWRKVESGDDLNAVSSECRVFEVTYETWSQVDLDGGVERSEGSC